MAKRVPASVRPRESLSDLIEGRLSSADGRATLVKLATRLIVEETLETESRDALGREYNEHGAPLRRSSTGQPPSLFSMQAMKELRAQEGGTPAARSSLSVSSTMLRSPDAGTQALRTSGAFVLQ